MYTEDFSKDAMIKLSDKTGIAVDKLKTLPVENLTNYYNRLNEFQAGPIGRFLDKVVLPLGCGALGAGFAGCMVSFIGVLSGLVSPNTGHAAYIGFGQLAALGATGALTSLPFMLMNGSAETKHTNEIAHEIKLDLA